MHHSSEIWQQQPIISNVDRLSVTRVCVFAACRTYTWWLAGWTCWRRNWSRRPSKATKISVYSSVRSRRRQPSHISSRREYWSRRSRSPTSRRLACMRTCTRHWTTSTRFVCTVGTVHLVMRYRLRGWRRGVVVTALVVSTKLLYVEHG